MDAGKTLLVSAASFASLFLRIFSIVLPHPPLTVHLYYTIFVDPYHASLTPLPVNRIIYFPRPLLSHPSILESPISTCDESFRTLSQVVY